MTSSIGRALGAVLLLAMATATVLLGGATTSPAAAHVTLVSSDPAPDAELPDTPPGITLTFAGELEPTAEVVVTGPDGSEQQAGVAIVSGDTVIQRISDLGGQGQYTISYAVTATDGHQIAGESRFAVGEPVEGADPGTEPGTEPSDRSTLTPEDGGSASPAAETVDSEQAASEEDDGGSGLTWIIVAAGVVLAAGSVLWWWRGRSHGSAR